LLKKQQFLVRASFLEIYNEEIRDLLSRDPKNKLELKEDVERGVYVKDLISYVVKSVEEMEHVLNAGKKNRSVGATQMNQVHPPPFGQSELALFPLCFTPPPAPRHVCYRRTSVIIASPPPPPLFEEVPIAHQPHPRTQDSSRSHSVFSIVVERTSRGEDGSKCAI
jgi:hypothetical protein